MVRCYVGDARDVLRILPSESVHCCITSPPYWGLRDYGVDGQIGHELSLNEYLENMVTVFSEVKRVLHRMGTLWLNMGDCYAGSGKPCNPVGKQGSNRGTRINSVTSGYVPDGLKRKDLIGLPWRVAFALQSDGWYLRQDIIWNKLNVMPESVKDRCTGSHEYVFLLSKSPAYWFDAAAIREPLAESSVKRAQYSWKCDRPSAKGVHNVASMAGRYVKAEGRNRRSVWSLPTAYYRGVHVAVFPPKLVELCLLAGCPASVCSVCGCAACDCVSSRVPGVVLDPFAGSGTTGRVACLHSRDAVMIELNAEYIREAVKQIGLDADYRMVGGGAG